MKKAKNVDELISSIKNGRFTLDGSDLIVSTDFDCIDNKLTTLKGAPEEVDGSFYCYHNKLTTLNGAPKEVGGYFVCSHNNLTTLEGAPKEVGGSFSCTNNDLTSLHNIHKHINKIGGNFYYAHNPIKEAILGLLLINGLKEVKINTVINEIINKYLPSSNKANVYKCAQELINAGYPELAKI